MNNLMNHLFLIFCYFTIYGTCLKHSEYKLCVNCKFYKSDFPWGGNEFGKCKQFPNIETIDRNFLVTGIKKKPLIEYQYCALVREDDNKCGQEGKLYEEK